MEATVSFLPNAGQLRFLRGRELYRLACSGVGGGKSSVGAIEALRLAVENPGSRGIILSPTYDMLRLNTVPPIAEWWPDAIIANLDLWQSVQRRSHNNPFDLHLINGSTLYFRSAKDPDSFRGPNMAWAWLDEAGMMHEYVWKVLLGRIRQPCRRPGVILTTTPRGLTWLYDLFLAHRPSEDYGLYTWGARDNADNLRPGYHDELAAALTPLEKQQEIDGEFVDIRADTWLPSQAVLACERDNLPKLFKQDLPLYVGVDIGRHHDLTVAWGLTLVGDTFYTSLLKIMAQTPFRDQERYLCSLAPTCVRMCIDKMGLGMQLAEGMARQFPAVAEGIEFTNRSKDMMAGLLRQHFERETIRIPRSTEIREDLLSVQRVILPGGGVRLLAPRTQAGHADRFWALALACLAAHQRPEEELTLTVIGQGDEDEY